MSDLLSVTIDAGVLAVPDINCTENDAFQYVETLLDWKKLLNESWLAIYMSERVSESLGADDLYPLRSHLNDLFKEHKIFEYDVNTVATVVDQLLRITPSFETHYCLHDVLHDKFKTEPDIIQLVPYENLQTDMARCITLIAILCKHCSRPLGGHSFILKKAPQQVVKVQATIDYIEHSRDDIPVSSFPHFFEGEVFVCDNFKGLIESLDEETILHKATDDLGIELAIRIAAFKDDIRNGKEVEWDNITIPKIGSKFRDSCQACCDDQSGSIRKKILHSIIKTTKKQNLGDVHALRTGKGGSNPQRMRNFDKAQRRDIDNDIHLHYWECPNGVIELGYVVQHNDFSIPE